MPLPGENMKPREIRIPALDGLRGVAIALVLFWHFILCSIPCTGGTAFGYFNKLFRHSYSGVDLFFVLSGFLITQILLRDVGSKDWLKRFWIRRAFRILPLYFLFLLAAMIFSLMGNPAQGGYFTTPNPIWPYLLMLQNIEMARQRSLGTWGVTWSLAVEEQFYLFYPAIHQH